MIFTSQSGTPPQPRPREVKPLSSGHTAKKRKSRDLAPGSSGSTAGWDCGGVDGHVTAGSALSCDLRSHLQNGPGDPTASSAGRAGRCWPSTPSGGAEALGGTAGSRLAVGAPSRPSGLARWGFSPGVGGTGAPPPSARAHVQRSRWREDGGPAGHRPARAACPGGAPGGKPAATPGKDRPFRG